jgi:hypothetical protein
MTIPKAILRAAQRAAFALYFVTPPARFVLPVASLYFLGRFYVNEILPYYLYSNNPAMLKSIEVIKEQKAMRKEIAKQQKLRNQGKPYKNVWSGD